VAPPTIPWASRRVAIIIEVLSKSISIDLFSCVVCIVCIVCIVYFYKRYLIRSSRSGSQHFSNKLWSNGRIDDEHRINEMNIPSVKMRLQRSAPPLDFEEA